MQDNDGRTGIVRTEVHDEVAVVIVDHPPLNVLAAPVRQGVAQALDRIAAQPEVRAVVLACAGKTFFSGADITEFGAEIASPDLPALVERIAAHRQPIVAAMHGTALGGGFELALACVARVATTGARMGLPEVRLGLVPGCGGATRLTRIAGAAAALDLVTSGRTVAADEAREMGLVDDLVPDDPVAAAVALARNLVAEGVAARPQAPKAAADLFDRFRQDTAVRFRGQDAPAEAIRCVEAAATLPPDRALAAERDAFARLEAGPQSAALRHVFFAERAARQIDGLPLDTRPRSLRSVGIVGAGTMGRGIAMAFVAAGLPVVLIDQAQTALDRAMAAVRASYERGVARGGMSPAEAEARLARIAPHTRTEALAGCDLVIEAVFEDMAVKEVVFRRIDVVAQPGAILATNTSFLDIDRIASATSRPHDVVGLHFFSPAQVMRLLEVVRGARTAPDVLATAMHLARTLGKIGVCVGNCHGFVGNRMLARRQAAAGELILEGASPWQVDSVLHDFGFPMGPFAMADLAGLDLGWDPERSGGATIEDLLCEAGRFGQKTGAGYYDYDEARRAAPSALTDRLLVGLSERQEITRRPISDDEILARCLDPMIVEGRRILDEGIAQRGSDIDTIWINGYGWPAWTGGPIYWADNRGS